MNEIAIISETDIKDKIYTIRGVKVMIDSDLAKIYGYTVGSFNRQVKNNIERFDDDFRFQLTDEEVLELSRCKNCISIQTKGVKGGRTYNPYAFTEQGIYMLMTVLKGERAIKESKALIKIFKEMKDYLVDNNLIDQKYINNLVLKQEHKLLDYDQRLSKVENSIDDLTKTSKIFIEGSIYDAYSFLLDIFNKSNKNITIIDNYINKDVLDLIRPLDIDITIISKNISDELIKKYKSQYSNITFINDDSIHDRFILVDNKYLYCLGSSIKDFGKKTTCITYIKDTEEINKIINQINNML